MKTEERKPKEYRLDLSKYDVESREVVRDENGKVDVKDGKPMVELKSIEYPLRNNLSDFLRSVGMFKTAEDAAEGIVLAKAIRNEKSVGLILDGKEARVLKYALNRIIELTAEGKANIGGSTHEEMICRVVNMEVVEE